MKRLEGAKILHLPKITDPRGNMSVVEEKRHIPFEIKRLFYLYDVPGGESRGGHANIELQQFVIAASGSFNVILDDGYSKLTFTLNRSYYGLYIPGMLWRELTNFSSGAVCLVLASDFYNEADYYRSYDEYAAAIRRLDGR